MCNSFCCDSVRFIFSCEHDYDFVFGLGSFVGFMQKKGGLCCSGSDLRYMGEVGAWGF